MKPEDKVLELSIDMWNEFLLIEDKHPSDVEEFRHSLHRLQDMIYSHKYRKENGLDKHLK